MPQLTNTKIGSDASRYWKLGKKIVQGLNNDQSAYRLYEDLLAWSKSAWRRRLVRFFPEVPFVINPEIRDTWG